MISSAVGGKGDLPLSGQCCWAWGRLRETGGVGLEGSAVFWVHWVLL